MSSVHANPGVNPAGSISLSELALIPRGSLLGNSGTANEYLDFKANGAIMIGDGNDNPAQTVSGDILLSNAGVVTQQQVATSGAGAVYLTSGSISAGTVTINGRAYFFTGTAGGGDVDMGAASGADPNDDAATIVAAINGDGSADVVAATQGGPAAHVTLVAKTAGSATNYTLAVSNFAGGTADVSAATLTGGTAATTKRRVVMSRVLTTTEVVGGGGAAEGAIAFGTGLTTITHKAIQRTDTGGKTEQGDNSTAGVSGGTILVREGSDTWVAGDLITVTAWGS